MPNSRSGRKSAKRQSRSKRRATGRPEFVPTIKQRRDVEIAVFFDRSEDDIARAIGICRNTYRKAFAEEIKNGKAKCQLERDIALYNAGIGGNVSALKAMTQAPAVRTPLLTEPKPTKLGKKELEHAAATTAGENSDWGNDLAIPSLGRPN